jgi:hypothetical protein
MVSDRLVAELAPQQGAVADHRGDAGRDGRALVTDLHVDHVVVGVDGQLDRSMRVTDGLGHQHGGHSFGIGQQGREAGGGHRLDRDLPGRGWRLWLGGEPSDEVTFGRLVENATAGQHPTR